MDITITSKTTSNATKQLNTTESERDNTRHISVDSNDILNSFVKNKFI